MSRSPIRTVVRKRFSRRDLVKLAPIAGVGGAAIALGVIGTSTSVNAETVGTCRFCLMHCGIVCHLRDGQLVKVEGDLKSRTRGFVCEHGYALRELVHSNERIRHPLIRRGDAFHEVSWDDALGEIAARLENIRQRYGAESLAIQTGWPFVRHPMINFLHRFARAFGSPNVATVASLCEASLRMGQALTVGTKYSPDIRRVKTLVVWGANPPTTAPPFMHVVAAKAASGNLIVIDPVKTLLAKEATMHVSVRPGTDGALALGLINLVVSERRYDADFVAKYTRGFDELASLAATFPPERVEQITSVPVAQLVRVARMISDDRPIGVWQGLGVEHHESGVQTVRAISSLEVLCGRFDGTHDEKSQVSRFSPKATNEKLPALYRMRTPQPVPPPIRSAPLGRDRFPLYEVFNREAQGELLADAILDDTPYPVRALILWASNALITASGSQRMAEAAEKLDLLVTIDPFLSASAQQSDIVLPASTFAESLDVDADDERVAQQSLVPAVGDAKADFNILSDLARATGLGAYFPWKNFHEAMRAPHVAWMQDREVEIHPQLETDDPKFGTVSGKVEFASPLLEKHQYAGLPLWTPPTLIPSKEFPLRLVTGPRPRARINSQFQQSPSVTARMREPELLIHPQAAEHAKIIHGARVKLVSPVGEIAIRAVVTKDVHPECVVMPAGWASANANLLISDRHRDQISGFPAFRSGICRVEPIQQR